MSAVVVVKVGGVLLENPSAAVEHIRSGQAGAFVVVHGGGVQITRMLDRMKVESHFVDGLRVTDEAALGGVAAALMGEVHTALVLALQQAGVKAMGVFGAVKASRKPGPWGYVGTDVKVVGSMLQQLLDDHIVPVIPTLALGSESLLNINGDETAAAVAIALRADRLTFLTDVEGVRDANGATIARVPREVSLVDAPFVSGGMKPKLRAVAAALAGGVASVQVGRTLFG